MDVFKQQLERVQQQLGQLTGTQRMLVGSLVVVMVLTLLLWSRYASAPDLAPLLGAGVSTSAQAQIQQALDMRGIKVKASSGQLMVAPEDRLRAVAIITAENLLPSADSHTLDEILAKGTPFDSNDRTNKLWWVYRQTQLQQIIALMDGVRDARVMIDNTTQFRFSNPVSPTAAVHVKTSQPGQRAPKTLVDGIASLINGAVAGIKRGDIQIVIDSRSYPVNEVGLAGAAGDMLERQGEWESYYAEKVTKALQYIPGMHVAVAVKLNNETVELRERNVESVTSKEAEITSDTTESNQTTTTITDPGVGANTSTPVSVPAGGNGNTQTTEKSVTKLAHFPSTKDQTTIKPGGEAVPVTATVAIPRSWFVAQVKGLAPTSKDPDPQQIDQEIVARRGQLLEAVQKALNLADASSVQITTFVDNLPDLAAAGSTATAGGGIIAISLTSYAKEIAIGLLAVVSLFMVSMMVRKATPPPLVIPETTKKPREEAEPIDGAETLAGIATVGNPALDGMELGDDEIKSQQMVDQVSSMVKENPDAAAQLVKRWLNRS